MALHTQDGCLCKCLPAVAATILRTRLRTGRCMSTMGDVVVPHAEHKPPLRLHIHPHVCSTQLVWLVGSHLMLARCAFTAVHSVHHRLRCSCF